MQKTIRHLLGIIFIDQIYITIAFPLLALIFFDPTSRLFSSDTPTAARSIWYGLCVALPNFINLFFSPCLSILSDTYGRRTILLLEIFSAFFFTLLVGCGVYTGHLALVFLGFLVRGAFSRTNPTALAIIGDSCSKEKKIRYMGYLQFAISVGALIGPLLGGYTANHFYFSTFNFSLPFFIAAGLALANSVLAYFLIAETLNDKASHLPLLRSLNLKQMLQIACRPEIRRISLILFLLQISWSTYYQFMPAILKVSYGFDSHALGWFIGMIAFWLAVATSVGIPLAQRFLSLRHILLFAFYLVLLGLLIAIATPFVWISAVPTAIGDVIAYTCLMAMYSNVVAQNEQGKVMGMSFIIIGLVWSFTGFMGGMLMSLLPSLPLYIAPISLIIALGLLHTRLGKSIQPAVYTENQ